MKSRLSALAGALALIVAAGLVGPRVGDPAWRKLRRDMPELTAGDIEVAAGEGVMVGLLGGFRAIMADLMWVRTNATWEVRDLPATQAMIRLVTTLDSRPLVFWINGARMIAYDMPVWRLEEAGGERAVPDAVRERIDFEQAHAALTLLARARLHHPDEPLLVIEMANIHQRRLRDLEGAAALYRRAAEMPGAPYYAARIHAEMLKQLGREAEAYEWLKEVHSGLPVGDAMAMSEIVLGRIRELEERLQVPPALRYHAKTEPSAPSAVPAER